MLRTFDSYPVFVSQAGNIGITLSSQVAGNGTFPIHTNYNWQVDQSGMPSAPECFQNNECGHWEYADDGVDPSAIDWTGYEWVIDYFPGVVNDTLRAQGRLDTHVNVYKNGQWFMGLDADIVYDDVEFAVMSDPTYWLVGELSYEGTASGIWNVPVEEGDFLEFVASTRVITVASEALGLSEWGGRSVVQNDYGYMEFIMP